MIAELKSKLVAGRIAAALTLATLLSACGGGGGSSGAAGTPLLGTTPSGTSSAVASLSVAPAPVTLPNDGSATATITVTALDASNVTLKGVPISFSADSGTISPVGTVTDDKGELKATLGIGDNKTKRTITITAAAGGVSKTATVSVVESTTATPTASDASVALSKASVLNTGSDSVEATLTAVDASRNAVANLPVKFRSDDGSAVIAVSNGTTDVNGQAKATVRIGADRNNRTINVIAEVGTLSRQVSFRVTGSKLVGQPSPAQLTTGTRGTVEYTLSDSGNNPIVGSSLAISGPGGLSATGTTDASGKYIYSYIASGAGPTLISAVAPGDVRAENTVQIDAAVSDVPTSTVIASATFNASPLVVNVNQVGSSVNRSELRLLFRSDKNEPVPNVRVRLGLGANSSGTDGYISTGNDAVIIADANGVAVSSFVSGRRSSPTEQVKIFACFSKTNSVPQVASCPAENLKLVALTVVEAPVSISIGFNNAITINKDTYSQDFVVLVVDAAGNPKPDAQLSAVLDLPTYLKGFWSRVGSTWVKSEMAQCINEDNSPGIGYRNNTMETEDVNGNGVLDPGEDVNFNGRLDREDINGNGQLDPRKSDISLTFVGSDRTDSTGKAVLRIEYPQNFGSWVEYSIRVSASGVVSPPAWTGRLAAEGDTVGTLKGLARILGVPNDVVKAEAEPSFSKSPYGLTNRCDSPN